MFNTRNIDLYKDYIDVESELYKKIGFPFDVISEKLAGVIALLTKERKIVAISKSSDFLNIKGLKEVVILNNIGDIFAVKFQHQNGQVLFV